MTRKYVLSLDMAADLCKAMGLDPDRVTRMRFAWDAGDTKPLSIIVEFLPEYNGLPATFKPVEVPSDEIDNFEAGYHASET